MTPACARGPARSLTSGHPAERLRAGVLARRVGGQLVSVHVLDSRGSLRYLGVLVRLKDCRNLPTRDGVWVSVLCDPW